MSRTGRPPKDGDLRTNQLHCRVTNQEKAEIQNFCKEFNVTLLDLIRKGIDAFRQQK